MIIRIIIIIIIRIINNYDDGDNAKHKNYNMYLSLPLSWTSKD